MDGVHHRFVAASSALAPFVSRFRVVTASSDAVERTWTRLPEVTTAIVLCREDGALGHLVAVGPGTRARSRSITGIPFHVRAELRPGAAHALLGAPLAELGDRATDLAELWGPLPAAPAFDAETTDPRLAIRTIEALLLERVRRIGEARLREQTKLAARVTQLAASSETVPTWARRVGMSERSLRRLFRDEIGVSPSLYARIARLRAAIARAGTARWSRVAADLGFADASHLAAEFRAFLGTAPTRFVDGHARCGR
jgi:AraC-like DNA-binding protein